MRHSRNGAGMPHEPEPTMSAASIGMNRPEPISVMPKASRATKSKRSSTAAWISLRRP